MQTPQGALGDKMNCKYCGKKLTKRNNIFCNNDCFQLERWKKIKDVVETSGIANNPWIAKKYLEEINGHVCSICGIKEWNNQYLMLILDHIDGNSENNSVYNLRLVCSNCDSQLPTYKSRNFGKGRFSRRERYKEDKSY